jgi:hypothetical protein
MPKKNAPETESKSEALSFKKFAKMVNEGGKPRGLKFTSNSDGGYTFSYGSKSAPVAVIASKDELVALGLASLGLKL